MGTSQMWEPLTTTYVSTQVSDQIQNLIGTKRLKPGDRLPAERELAHLLHVSRASVREAFKSLQAQGVVDIRHGQGVFVAEPHAAASLRAALIQREIGVEELYAMREVLELPAVEWAAQRRDPDGMAELTEAFSALDACAYAEEIDFERMRMLDTAFHLSTVSAAGNQFLQQTTIVLHEILAAGMATTLRAPGRVEKSRVDHRLIYEAIIAGDAEEARRVAKEHIDAARETAMSRVASAEAAGIERETENPQP
ncbi:FadR/GntR family transcriptional regulator [Brachybacterium sp. GCM10030252]|uniref:FadR/GntR family transcriptional regulator n=1 Tax=Brachybacterium sp. GCM10030252 TaxID=3273380 RepID=UPI0036229C1B